MNDWLLILPILVPLLTALATLALRGSPRARAAVSVVGAACLLAAGGGLMAAVWNQGPVATAIGSWPAPYGIALAADTLSALMVVLAGLMGLAVAVYSIADIDAREEALGYHPLYHFLLLGVSGAFLTADLFNLFVWFEVMLLASFVLLALGGRASQLEGALKYVSLNLLSSALFLMAVGLVYGVAGTLNMAHLAEVFASEVEPGLALVIAMLFLVTFGIKAAVFPLYGWLPASYHTPPVAVSALFAGLLTKVGVYALVRVFTLLFVGPDAAPTPAHDVILVIAGLTMVTGVLGAAAQFEIRRILSFHIVSQIGYMVLGLGLMTPLALAGTVFYLGHHIIVKTTLFLIGGVVGRLNGSEHLDKTGGLYAARPWLAVLFLIPALSLAGIPPLSGFWAKLVLIDASVEAEQWALVATALVVGLLTLYSMTKIWANAFWRPAPAPLSDLERAERGFRIAPVAVLAALTVTIGLVAQPLAELATRAAGELLEPSAYIRAVMTAGGR
jgi:multicomponent Na+:H+ antiporter subunit D